MSICAGIDEAGYGPTLGPLTVTATAFKLQAEGDYSALAHAFPRVMDSKKVFTPRKGLEGLEQSVLPFFSVWFGTSPRSLSELVERITEHEYSRVFDRSPWFTGSDPAVPVEADSTGSARDMLNRSGVLSGYAAARIVNVPLFNTAIRQGFNKSTLLFSSVCELISCVMQQYTEDDIRFTVDRLGGRKFYRRLLRENFPDCMIETVQETAAESAYCLYERDRTVRVAFRVGADSDDFCTGLASLVSKYLRELCMHQFNSFFCSRQKGLKATQGYPQDAERFLNDIAGTVSTDELDRLIRLR